MSIETPFINDAGDVLMIPHPTTGDLTLVAVIDGHEHRWTITESDRLQIPHALNLGITRG